MTEKNIIDVFTHFSEDLDPKIKKKFKNLDSSGYHSIIMSNKWWPSRNMPYDKKDVDNYSFEELYEQMCDLFYSLEDKNDDAIYKIILLKNFINYKMQFGG